MELRYEPLMQKSSIMTRDDTIYKNAADASTPSSPAKPYPVNFSRERPDHPERRLEGNDSHHVPPLPARGRGDNHGGEKENKDEDENGGFKRFPAAHD